MQQIHDKSLLLSSLYNILSVLHLQNLDHIIPLINPVLGKASHIGSHPALSLWS